MVSQPFADNVSKNSGVYQKGGFYFIKIALERNGLLLPVHADTWLMDNVAVITDPADVDVTDDFATNELDPAGIFDTDGELLGDDTYDEDHATYKGDLADPPNVGLFSDDQGHLALKSLVPPDAVENYLSLTSNYTVTWNVLVPDGAGGTIPISGSETFKVAPAGTFIFEDLIITVEEATRGISTSMDPEQIEDLVARATQWFTGEVIARSAGTLTDPLSYFGPNGKRAIIMMTQSDIMTFDVSAGVIKSVREGPDQVTYGGREGLVDKWMTAADRALALYLREVLGRGKPFVGRTDRVPEIESPPLDRGFVLVVP